MWRRLPAIVVLGTLVVGAQILHSSYGALGNNPRRGGRISRARIALDASEDEEARDSVLRADVGEKLLGVAQPAADPSTGAHGFGRRAGPAEASLAASRDRTMPVGTDGPEHSAAKERTEHPPPGDNSPGLDDGGDSQQTSDSASRSPGDDRPVAVPVELRQAAQGGRAYVALCLAVKDEQFYIREWVAYHQSIGVGRIYIYDDGSRPPMRSDLADFIESGLVHYLLLDGPIGAPGERQQLAVYNDCIRRFGSNHTWLGMIDGDEFFMLMDPSLPSLPDVLVRYEQYGGLVANWRLFGSSGHTTRPKGGVLQSYTACTPAGYSENVHVKSVVRPERVKAASWSPHHFEYHDGFYAVNTHHSRVDGPFSDPILGDTLLVHHYAVRSAEDFQQKLAKGNGMGPDHLKTVDFWDRMEKFSTENCTYAVPLGAKIQAQLAGAGGAAASDEQAAGREAGDASAVEESGERETGASGPGTAAEGGESAAAEVEAAAGAPDAASSQSRRGA